MAVMLVQFKQHLLNILIKEKDRLLLKTVKILMSFKNKIIE